MMEGDRKYLAAAVVFAVVCGLVTIFFHLRTEPAIDAYNREIAEYNREIEKITKFKANHKNIDEDMAELAKRHYRVATMFPNQIDEEKTVEFLRELASETELYLLAIQSDKEKLDESKKAYAQKFTVKVRGNYFHILDFMKALSTDENFYDVNKMTIKNDNGDITMEIEINCYFSKGKNEGK